MRFRIAALALALTTPALAGELPIWLNGAATQTEDAAALLYYRTACPDSPTKMPDSMFEMVIDSLAGKADFLAAMVRATKDEAYDHASFCSFDGKMIVELIRMRPELAK
jgi:hypothetical protein